MYCVPCRIKYKYPAFSENIEELPGTEDPLCWWKNFLSCRNEMLETDALDHLTKGCGMPT